MITTVEERSNLIGLQCSRGGPQISHLFFVDDSIVFARANIKDTKEIKRILKLYEEASGQKVNMEKSAITFSPNVEVQCRQRILEVLGLTVVQSHDKYLGLPTVVGLNKKRTFEEIKHIIRK